MINHTVGRLLLLPFLLILTHCASIAPPAQNQSLSWAKREQQLSAIQSWDLHGAIAIHATQNSGSATLHWQQQGQQYTISLFAPLGAYSFTLTGQPQQIEFVRWDGKKFHAKDPETLMAQQLGWHLPLSNLTYWIRGLPAPQIAAEKRFDDYHHLIQLNQQGWNIEFLRYTTVNGIDLPAKMVLKYPQLNVKIIVSQWQLPSR
jgi:outer membrane lipoprotein LolB